MSRKITISKYEDNTVYSVHVYDSFGKEHHLGYLNCEVIDELKYCNQPRKVTQQNIIEQAQEIWSNETKKEVSLMSKAIKECIEIDRKSGLLTGNRDNLD